jgi:hypothetical protein
MKLRYQMTCGCEIKKEERVQVYYVDEEGQHLKWCCPEHKIKGQIISRSIVCNKCGIVRMLSPRGGILPDLCKKHQDKEDMETRRINSAKAWHKANNIKKQKKAGNRFHCEYYKTLCGMCIKPYFPCKMYAEAS